MAESELKVRFFAQPGVMGCARISDISASGARLHTQALLEPGVIIYLEMFDHVRRGRRNRLCARVLRQDEGGAGIVWCDAARSTPLRSRPHVRTPKKIDGVFRYRFDFQD
jgi:hypothetical protein